MNFLQQLLPTLHSGRIGIPVIILSILAMIILPLPPLVLDILFTFNIGIALLVLMVSVSSRSPLDFSLLPTVILVTTLLRLSLNVASTRVVLLDGHTGTAAAGKVIEAFGHVVIGGSFIVGLIVFVILTIVNFMVITKGGERISEVTARFTLDALPGKQMAIDADLNAGLIDQAEAKRRRAEVAKEADFYGAMDGASKFVRGDAIAGILILLINLIGGVAIGSLMHDLPLGESFRLYALLTIGDGLVAQIPALLLSAASAVIVTRISDADAGEFSDQVRQQLLAKPAVLYSAAGVMLVLGLIPGMPWMPFLAFAAVLVLGGWAMAKQPGGVQPAPDNLGLLQSVTAAAVQDFGWQSLPITEQLSVRVGYRLVSQLDPGQGAPLATRLKGVRQSVSEAMGFVLPPVHVRDDLTLPPNQYAILINDSIVAKAEVHADKLMAIPSPHVYGQLDGIPGIEPAYQLPVTWIDPKDKAHALGMGYQVADCVSIVATHVTRVVRQHLDELIRHDDVHALHERLNALSPKLAAALEKACPAQLQHAVFKQLLREGVALKDIVQIATALLDSIDTTKDPILLTAEVRCALRRQLVSTAPEIKAFTLGTELEQLLLGALSSARHTNKKVPLDNYPVDPSLLGQLQEHMAHARDLMKQQATAPILLVTPQLRPLLARYARLFAQGLQVLSFNEVPEGKELKVLGTVG